MPEVRQHYHSIVEELVSLGVDGVELDFFRHPAFFRREEAFTNRYLMTDFIRRCRVSLDAAGAARSRTSPSSSRPTTAEATASATKSAKAAGAPCSTAASRRAA